MAHSQRIHLVLTGECKAALSVALSIVILTVLLLITALTALIIFLVSKSHIHADFLISPVCQPFYRQRYFLSAA